MKYLIVFILSILILVGCGKETEQQPVEEKNKFAFDSTDIKTTSADNPNETFQLSYKLEKDKKYNYRLSVISKDNQTMQADTTIIQNITQNIIYLITLTGKDADNEGVMEIECNITSVKLDAKGGDQSFSYESGKADSADKARYFDYEMLVNNPFSMRVAKNGDILEVFRVDRILNKLLDLKGYTDSVTAEQKNVLRRDLSEGALRQLMSLVFREVPEKTLAKDSSWTKTQPEAQLMIFKMQNTNSYKIESLEMLEDDKVAVIDADLSTNITGETDFTERGIAYKFKKPLTSAEGKIFFNITDGMVQKSRTKTTVTISYTMEAMTPEGKRNGSKVQTVENLNIIERL